MAYLGNRPATGENNAFRILDDISSHVVTFNASSSSVVSLANDTITIPANEHRFITGQRVTYAKGSGGTIITGLAEGVYYIIDDGPTTFKLATTLSNANSSVAVNFTGLGAGTAHTITLAFDDVNTKFKPTYLDGTQNPLITRAAQLVISINGIIQQPHDSTSPTSGFGIDTSNGDLIFSQAPNVNDEFWGHVHASNTVTFDISDNKIDNFTGNGSTTEFTLSKTPPNNENILVTIDGVIQYPTDGNTTRAYTLSENLIQFASAPGLNTVIQVRHIGFAGNSTAAGSGGVTGFYGRTGNVVLKNTDNIIANDATFSGNVAIAKTLTYMDVSYIDAVGIITAQSDVEFNGSGVGISSAYWDSSANEFKFKDNVKLSFGDSQDLSVYHTGSAGYISNTSSALYLRAKTNQNGVNIWPDGVVQLHHSGTEVLETQSWGFWSHGTIKPSADTYDLGGNHVSNRWNDVYIADTGELRLGDGNDLVIVHDGNNSTISNTTGGLYLQSDTSINIDSKTGGAQYIHCEKGAEVSLWHNNVKTFETTGLGIKVSGPEGGNSEIELFADEGDDNNDKWKILTNSNGNFYVQNYGAGSYQNAILARPQGTIELLHGGNKKFETTNRGIKLQSGLTSGNGMSNMLQLDNDGNSNADGSYITFSRAGYLRSKIGAIKNETANNETDIVFETTLAGSIGEKLRIKSDGKIGIGDDDPDGNHLLIRAASTVGTTKGHIMLTGDSATNGQGPQIVFSESGQASNFAGAYIGHIRTTTNSVGDLVFGTRASGGDANTVPTERLRITSTGLVGIRTDAPGEVLDVNGAIRLRGSNYTTYAAKLYAALDSTHCVRLDAYHNSNTAFEIIGTHADSGGANVRIVIAKGGHKVGIGEDAPQQKLHLHEASSNGNFMVFTNTSTGATGNDGCLFGINSDEGGTIWNQENNYIRFGTNDTERLRIHSDGKITVNSTGSQPSPTVGGFQLDMGSFPGTMRLSQGAGASGTNSGSITIIGSNHNASLAHGANHGAQLNLINANSTDGNSTCVGFYNSNQLSIARVLGTNVSHSSRTGMLVFMTSNGSHPVEQARIDSSGSMMVGATASGGWKFKVQVAANASYQSAVNITNGVNADLQFEIKNSESRFGPSTQTPLVFKTHHTERARIASDGKVSIGNLASPDSLLHIHDGSAGSVTASTAAKLTIESSASDYNVLQFLSPATAAQQVRFGDAADNGAGWIQYNHANNALAFGANGPERLKIDSSGHLTLQGGKIYGEDNASNSFHLQSTSGNSNHSRVEIGTISNSDNGGIHFYTAGSSTATQRMVIKGTSGRVGIAQANPQAKLDVSGAYNEVGLRASGGASGYSSSFIFMHANGDTVLEGNSARHVIPGADAVQDLGISTKRWRNVYTTDLQLSNVGGGGNEVDGTEGTWTLQEGEDDIYMINRKTGKKYKMMLQEVS